MGWDVNVHVNDHWIGNKDPWKTQGEVLKAVRDLQLLWRNRKKLVSHVSGDDDDADDDADDDDEDDDDEHDPNETC